MSKQTAKELDSKRAPTLIGSPPYAHDRGARRLAVLSLLITMIVLLFGDNVVGRAVVYLKSYWPWFQTSVNGLEGSIAIINILLAAFALWDPKTRQAIRRADEAPTAQSTKDSFERLMLGWRLLWLARMLLYIWLGAHWFGLYKLVPQKVTWQVASALHLLVGFFHYFLFFVLDPPSIATAWKPDSALVFRRSVTTMLVLACAVYITSTLISLYPSTPSSLGVTSMLSHRLIPIYAGIGMAFLIGRLDSHYLRIPRLLLAPLYLYVIVQPVWGLIAETDFKSVIPERATIFGLVLLLKFVFFYSVVKWIRNGCFLQYLTKIEADQNK